MTKKSQKYKGLKKCTLPLSVVNKGTYTWVFNDESGVTEYKDLYNAFSSIIKDELTFNYEITYKYYSVENNSIKSEAIISHSHDFDGVIEALYYYPESFNIPEKYQDDYSLKEREYLNKLQKYLLLIGLKDKTDSKEYIALQKKYKKELDSKKYLKEEAKLLHRETYDRVCNKKASNYNEAGYLNADDKILKAILEGDKNTRIFRQYSFSPSRVKSKFFIMDSDNNYKALIQITKEDIMAFKDLKVSAKEYKINGFKNLKDYKDSLYNYFKDDTIEGNFTEDSLISIATFKIIEKY